MHASDRIAINPKIMLRQAGDPRNTIPAELLLRKLGEGNRGPAPTEAGGRRPKDA